MKLALLALLPHTKSGNTILWPRLWCFLFGGTYLQRNGGYGTCYSIPSRIGRYYREGWNKHESLWRWIVSQGPIAVLVLLLLAVPAHADALDDEQASIRAQIAVLQAELVYIDKLKAAGYTSFPATSLPVAPVAVPMTAGACSEAAALSACGANASMSGDSGAGRNGPVRRLLGRLFGGRRAGGGCGG